jgi:hypothetical protein
MKMKLFVLLAIVVVTNNILSGQIKYGPRLGLSLTKMNLSTPDVSNNVYFFIRPQLGGFIDLHLSDKLHFQPNFLINFVGSGVSYQLSYSYDGKRKVTYFDMPLLFMLKLKFVENIRFNIILGGYAGIGLAGKNISTITSGTNKTTETTKIKWGNISGTDQLRRGDIGANLGFGFDFQRVQGCVIGSYSLMDLNPQVGLDKSSAYYNYHYRQYNLLITGSIAYFFGK